MNIPGVIAAASAFKEAMQDKTEPAEEILRRANICRNCPKRVRTTGVSRVSEFLGIIANRKKVPSSISGYSCGVCGCSMMLLLPATSENLHHDSDEEAKKRPAKCWLPQALAGD